MQPIYGIILIACLAGCTTTQEKWETGRTWKDANDCVISAHVNEDGYFRVTINGVQASEARIFCEVPPQTEEG